MHNAYTAWNDVQAAKLYFAVPEHFLLTHMVAIVIQEHYFEQ